MQPEVTDTGGATPPPVPPGAPEAQADQAPAEAAAPASAPVIELTLPTQTGYEKIARSAAASVAEYMGFSAERIEDLKTSVAEVCMNAIEHGNSLDPSLTVRVIMRALEDRLEVSVHDQGKKGLPDPLPEPGIPDPSRGWGLLFITQLMDEVRFARLPGGANCVDMVLYRDVVPALPPEPLAAGAEAVVQTAPADQAEFSVDNIPTDRVSLNGADSSEGQADMLAAAGDPATVPEAAESADQDHAPAHEQES